MYPNPRLGTLNPHKFDEILNSLCLVDGDVIQLQNSIVL